jgi:hypothetical protein
LRFIKQQVQEFELPFCVGQPVRETILSRHTAGMLTIALIVMGLWTVSRVIGRVE